MLNRKMLAMAGVGAMMIGLVACGSKAESNIAESATPEPTAEATPTPEPTEEPAESHDFDLSVNEYKTESDTADCDSGTDIEELDTLYDWLYNNGVTRESVQNDREEGCKNPYLDGYLEYLDGLAEKAAENVASSSAPEKVDPSTISGEKITLDGIDGEFTSDGAGGVYSPDGYHYTKEEWDSIKSSQKELAAMRENLDLPEEVHLTEEDKEKADQAVIDAFKDIYG